MPITIRDAAPADAPTLTRFNQQMALETEDKPLPAPVISAGVRAVLADPNKGRYWIAEAGSEIVGQIMTTWEWSDWRNAWFWWVQSVYVAEGWRRKGVFKALLAAVDTAASATGDACGIRLYVERDNSRAIKTYAALGFVDPGYTMLERPIQTREGS